MKVLKHRERPYLPASVVTHIVAKLNPIDTIRAGAVDKTWQLAARPRLDTFVSLTRSLPAQARPKWHYVYPESSRPWAMLRGSLLAFELCYSYGLPCDAGECGAWLGWTAGLGWDAAASPLRAVKAVVDANKRYRAEIKQWRESNEQAGRARLRGL